MAFLQKFLKKKDSTALGIDIGSSAIKIVELEKKNGQAILKTYGELALGPYADFGVGQAVSLKPDKIAEALVNLMREKEVNVSSKEAGLSIPFASSLMTMIEIPEVSEKQLASIVPLEARKYVPVPISEVVLDWSTIPKEGGGEQEVEAETKDDKESSKLPLKKIDILIAAIHKETITKYQDIVERSGLKANFFEIEIFSTMRSVLGDSTKPVMVIDMGAASTKVYIIERGIVRISHTVNRGSQDITTAISKSFGMTFNEAEILKREAGALSDGGGGGRNPASVISLVLNHIFAEANKTLLSFEKKYNKAVSQAILVGGGSSLRGLSDLVKENFQTETIIADPFSKVSTPAFLKHVLKETGPEFAVAIGLALRDLSEE